MIFLVESCFGDFEFYLQALLMVGGQRTQPGAHAQSPNTVCKVLRSEPGPAPILPRQMVATSVGGWQRRRRSAPRQRKDAQVHGYIMNSKNWCLG